MGLKEEEKGRLRRHVAKIQAEAVKLLRINTEFGRMGA